MKAKEFKIWQATVGLNGRQIAEALGRHPDTVTAYRSNGIPASEVATMRLAMAAIEAKLAPWYAK